MKTFINTKIGYSAGVYGCSGEYFKLVTCGDKPLILHYKGMYGVEDRVANVLKDAGFNEIYVGNRYGQLKGEERKGFLSEMEAIKEVGNWLKGNN